MSAFYPRLVGGKDVSDPVPVAAPSEITRVLDDARFREKELVHLSIAAMFADGDIYTNSTFVSHGDAAALLTAGAEIERDFHIEDLAAPEE